MRCEAVREVSHAYSGEIRACWCARICSQGEFWQRCAETGVSVLQCLLSEVGLR